MPWKCPFDACDGRGFVYDEQAHADAPCRCRPQMIAARRARGLSAVIPRRYRDVSFDAPPVTYMDERTVRAVKTYVRKLDDQLARGRGLWFFGPPGTGKTTLAMLSSKAAIAANHSVAVYSVPKLLDRIMQTYADNARESYSTVIEKLESVDLLQLDDVGSRHRARREARYGSARQILQKHGGRDNEKVLAESLLRENEVTDWSMEQIHNIVNARYEAKKALIITSNIDDTEELARQIGDRTVSRIKEMCFPIPVFGDDMRPKANSLSSENDELGQAS